MRRYHRWLSVIAGIFLLWIALTGVLSQVGSLVNNGRFERETAERGQRQAATAVAIVAPPASAHEQDEAAPARPAAVLAPFVCPPDMTCRPKRSPKPGEWNVGYLHHLHSGEEFGPVGVIISMLSGLSLMFFALSGLYLYIQMFRGRLVRTEAGRKVRGGRFFW